MEKIQRLWSQIGGINLRDAYRQVLKHRNTVKKVAFPIIVILAVAVFWVWGGEEEL